jgi:hypothetical protein
MREDIKRGRWGKWGIGLGYDVGDDGEGCWGWGGQGRGE